MDEQGYHDGYDAGYWDAVNEQVYASSAGPYVIEHVNYNLGYRDGFDAGQADNKRSA